MGTSSKNENYGMTSHIPDEYIAAWKEKSVEELTNLLDKAYNSLNEVSTETSKDHMENVIHWLESYIEERMTVGGDAQGELDVFT